MKRSKPKPEEEGDAEAWRRRALGLLARREHSSAEILAKLLDRGAPLDAARQVVQDLEREHLLSDHRFAEQYVRSRAERGFGPRRVVVELLQRGLAQEDAESAVAAVGDWAERCAAARAKRFGAEHPGDWKEIARQGKFLQYRGFSPDMIRRTMRTDE